jgi:uncharacterized protein (TIGR04255 family)
MALPRREYEEPPLVEAVAEFRFISDSWDQTVPGLFFTQVEAQFPEKEQVTVVETAVTQTEAGTQQTITPVERLRLRRADGSAIISISAHYLSISALPPYEGWEEFGPLISTALHHYRAIAAPSGLQRIGLRYVNQIPLSGSAEIRLEDYFNFYPHMGPDLPQKHSSFVCGVEIPYDEGRDLLKAQLADQPSPADAVLFLLDIDYFLARAGEVGFDDTEPWLLQAHHRVEQMFEGCITEALRAKFGVRKLDA